MWVWAGARRLVELVAHVARPEAVELWSHASYRAAFDALPELGELVSTPFMQQIVVNILHRLQAAGNPAEPALKSELHALLGAEALVNQVSVPAPPPFLSSPYYPSACPSRSLSLLCLCRPTTGMGAASQGQYPGARHWRSAAAPDAARRAVRLGALPSGPRPDPARRHQNGRPAKAARRHAWWLGGRRGRDADAAA